MLSLLEHAICLNFRLIPSFSLLVASLGSRNRRCRFTRMIVYTGRRNMEIGRVDCHSVNIKGCLLFFLHTGESMVRCSRRTSSPSRGKGRMRGSCGYGAKRAAK
jgi:hypothetical protein